jgi:hypothetical protein
VEGREPTLDLLGQDPPVTWARAVAATVASLLLLAGCTTSADDPAARRAAPASPSSPSEEPSGTTSAPVAPQRPPAPPPDGACYRLGFDQLTEPSNRSHPVPCSERHDAQTIHVGRLDTVVAGHALSVDSDRVLRQLSAECPRRFADHVGGTPQDRDLSRLEVVWFAPTLAQGDRGADWFRCDVVALAGREALFPLPPPRRLAGVLDGPEGAAYGLCGTATPGDPDFVRVICGRGHSWRAVSTIPLAGGRAYPGQDRVRRTGDETCRDRVRADAADPLKFRYGWEWPTREQWQRGQHFGYCWAPD